MSMGRPTDFTSELADAICARLSQGEPLAQICRDDGMPHPSTFRDWCDRGLTLDSGVSLAIAYARAREDGFDALAMDALHIADDNGRDTRFIKDGEGEREAPDHDWISRSKLRVETRLKLLAKWDPKRYGEKQTHEHSGPDGGEIATVTRIELVAVEPQRDDDGSA
jgi:hypothetical protein